MTPADDGPNMSIIGPGGHARTAAQIGGSERFVMITGVATAAPIAWRRVILASCIARASV